VRIRIRLVAGGGGGYYWDMNLRAQRLQCGLSLDELGRRAGVERSRLSRAERGYARLSEIELERIALVLDLPVEHLVESSGDPGS